MPVCQMNEYRPISAESQHNFHFFTLLLLKNYWTNFHHFLHDVDQLVDLLMRASARR